MSFVAEPYGTFVEDLLANLTGGVSRVRFSYVDEELPLRLGEEERARPGTLRVHGIASGVYTEFPDAALADDGTLTFPTTTPDAGTDVWVGFDRRLTRPPTFTDRNPGSVLRTLTESYSRELAVLSSQLELVHKAAFVATATGRDLDSLAALVGVSRRGVTNATGEVVFRRGTAAPADITVPAGTLVSSAAPPAVTVETTETVTLRRATLSVAAPVRATLPGPAGVAPADTLKVIHRPIFGVDEALNPQPLAFGGVVEPDEELRQRITRALETGGRSTAGALRGVLGSLDQIREQDVFIEEDHLAFPGVVRVTVAAVIDATTGIMASRLLEDYRPAGVRVVHNLLAPTTPLPSLAEDTGGGGDGPVAGADLTGVFVPVAARITVTPGDPQLTTEQRDTLLNDVVAALLAAVGEAGVGEPLIYNRLVAGVMAVPGVLDAVLEIGRKDAPPTRYNLRPLAGGTRFQLARSDVTTVLRGDRVVVDLGVVVERLGLAASAEAVSALDAARADIEHRLVQALLVTPAELSPAVLLGLLPATENYRVEALSYRVELLDEGLRIARQDVVVPLDPAQQVWIRRIDVTEQGVSG